jgi:hypothetical protein
MACKVSILSAVLCIVIDQLINHFKIANTNALVIFFLIIVTQIILIEINKVEIVSKTTILPCSHFLNNSKNKSVGY